MQTPEYEIFLVDHSNQVRSANQTFQWLYDDFTLSRSFVEEHEESYYDSDEDYSNEEKLLFEMHQENASYNATYNESIIRKCFKKGNALIACTKEEGACIGYLVWNTSEKGYGIEIVSIGVQIEHRKKGLMRLMTQTLIEQYPQLMVLALKSTPPARKVYDNSGWKRLKDDRVEKLNASTNIYFMTSKLGYCFDIYQTLLEENPAYQSIPMIENELFREKLIEQDPNWIDRWEEMVQSTLFDLQLKESGVSTTSYYKPVTPLSELLNEPPTGLSIQLCQEFEYKVIENAEAYQSQMKYYPLKLDEEGNLVDPFFFHLEAYRKNYFAICYDGEILKQGNKHFNNPEGYLHGSFKNLIGINSGSVDFSYQSINTDSRLGESFIIILDKLPDHLFRLIPRVIHEQEETIISLSNNPSSFIANLHQETSDRRSILKRGREEDEINKRNKKGRFLEKSEDKDTHSDSDDEFNYPFL